RSAHSPIDSLSPAMRKNSDAAEPPSRCARRGRGGVVHVRVHRPPAGTARSPRRPRPPPDRHPRGHARARSRGHAAPAPAAEPGREYRIAEGELPFFMHRERGLHLFEGDVTIDGAPVSAAVLGTALTLFHAGRAQAERGQGVYFYLPKLETAEEAGWYRDLF